MIESQTSTLKLVESNADHSRFIELVSQGIRDKEFRGDRKALLSMEFFTNMPNYCIPQHHELSHFLLMTAIILTLVHGSHEITVTVPALEI
jgi:hypothetical protein